MNGKRTTTLKANREYTRHKQSLSLEAERENGLVECLPLVKYVAGRLAMHLPRSVDLEDLINAGVVGLIDAYHNFDADKGVKFETYASLRIRGAMLDELRSMDWAPRSTRARSHQLEQAISRLENELGRPPTEWELAAELGVELAEYYQLIDEVSATALLSLDEPSYNDDDRSLVDTLPDQAPTNALSELEREEMRDLLADSLGQLSEPERLVVALYYYEELTLKEIGRVLNVTESRASQLHTKAMLNMKSKLRKQLIG